LNWPCGQNARLDEQAKGALRRASAPSGKMVERLTQPRAGTCAELLGVRALKHPGACRAARGASSTLTTAWQSCGKPSGGGWTTVRASCATIEIGVRSDCRPGTLSAVLGNECDYPTHDRVTELRQSFRQSLLDNRHDPMRIALAEDPLLLREGLARLLPTAASKSSRNPATGRDLPRKVVAHKPDLAIVGGDAPTQTDEDIRGAVQLLEAAVGVSARLLRLRADRAASRASARHAGAVRKRGQRKRGLEARTHLVFGRTGRGEASSAMLGVH
jgi:hypothetical protein